jgi:hypothetical protein
LREIYKRTFEKRFAPWIEYHSVPPQGSLKGGLSFPYVAWNCESSHVEPPLDREKNNRDESAKDTDPL